MSKVKWVQVRVSEEMHAKLAELAGAGEEAVSTYIRRIVAEHLRRVDKEAGKR